MPQTVMIPGMGEIDFPDTMTPEEVNSEASRLYDEHVARNEGAPNWATQPVLDTIGQGLKGVGTALWEGAKAVPGMIMHPVDTAKAAIEPLMPYSYDQKTQDALAGGRYSEAAGRMVGGSVPVVGPAVVQAGEDIGSNDPQRMGRGLTNTVGMVMAGSPSARQAVASVAPKVSSAVNTTIRAVEESPVASMAIGAGIGALEGGLPGALRGAAGGGLVGSLGRVAKAIRQQQAPKTPKDMQPRLVRGETMNDAVSSATSELLDEGGQFYRELPDQGVPGSGYTLPPRLAGDSPDIPDIEALTANRGGRLRASATPEGTVSLETALADTINEGRRPTLATGPLPGPGGATLPTDAALRESLERIGRSRVLDPPATPPPPPSPLAQRSGTAFMPGEVAMPAAPPPQAPAMPVPSPAPASAAPASPSIFSVRNNLRRTAGGMTPVKQGTSNTLANLPSARDGGSVTPTSYIEFWRNRLLQSMPPARRADPLTMARVEAMLDQIMKRGSAKPSTPSRPPSGE